VALTPSWRCSLTALTALIGLANSMQATMTPSAGATCFIMMLSDAMVLVCGCTPKNPRLYVFEDRTATADSAAGTLPK
jgi:hypothetical protein